MAGTKRKYDAVFKQEALRLLESSGKSVRQVEDELGITPGLLNKWKARYRLHPVTGEVAPREQHELEAENRRLRREFADYQRAFAARRVRLRSVASRITPWRTARLKPLPSTSTSYSPISNAGSV